jgi:glycosyltransferase involved in cell wall biosynthesis
MSGNVIRETANMGLTVVQVLPALEAGGVERGTLDVARELVRRGHRAIVRSAGGRMVAELNAAGAEHLAWSIGKKSPATLRYVPSLRNWLQKTPVDIVHARSRLPAWIAYAALKSLTAARRPRFVTTVHGAYSVSRYSAIMTRGDRVIAISDTIRDYVLSNYPEVNADRVDVIYRGVDRSFYAQNYRPDPKWSKAWFESFPQLAGRSVLTLPARLTRRKGHEDFLALIKALKSQQQAAHGLIVGGADPKHQRYLEELKARASALGLAADISFTEHRNDVREIMAVSDLVLVLSSKPEAFGRTTLEALSLGVPVVGYDHGGTHELLTRLFPEGRTPVDDVAALTAKTLDILQRKPSVPSFEGFTLEEMLNQTLRLYETLAGR